MLARPPRTKVEVRELRMSVLFGIIGGIFMFWLSNSLGAPNMGNPKLQWVSYPWFLPDGLKSFAPLNLVFLCFYFWLLMYMLTVKADKMNDTIDQGPKGWFKAGLGMFLAFAGMGGVVGTAFWGWFFSFQSAILLALLMCGVTIGLGTFLGVVFGGGYLLVIGVQKVWPLVRNNPVIRPFTRFGHYMNADDIPDQS